MPNSKHSTHRFASQDDDEWFYDSDDDQPETLAQRWDQFWKKKKEGRRHPTIRYLEKEFEKNENSKRLDREEYRKKEKKRRRAKLRKEILSKRHHDFMEYVAKVERDRKDADIAKRTRDTKALKVRMNLFEKWGVERADRLEKERIAFEKSEKKRLEKEDKEAKRAARQKAEDDAEADR